jgi:hypothetical protein
MGSAVTLPGDLTVPGNLRVNGAIQPAKTRASLLALAELQPFTVDWTAWRVWDALGTNLPATPANDDLGLVGGTFASASPSIQTGDLKTTTTTRYARAQIRLPAEYQAGETVTLRFHCGMLTTIASASATLDVQCYKSDEEAGISADLCTTDAKDINSVTLADQDFTITPTALSPGDLLDVRIAIVVTDAATGTAVIGIIGAVQLLCDVR